jgi:hypothetical protein
MKAILSATEHDYYAMPLPFVVYSWEKIGIECIVFIPSGENPKIELAKSYCKKTSFVEFNCEEKRIPTYSQVSRLFGSCVVDNKNETIITGDSDLAVFGDTFKKLDDGNIHVVGADLTNNNEYPMCFIAMPAHKWDSVMKITKGYQEHLSNIIDCIEGDNIRGNNWFLDQFLIKKNIDESGEPVIIHNRSNGQNQFAMHRADRDGWHYDVNTIIDSHLPRPLTIEDNFNKVYNLLKEKYPQDDLGWMIEYRNKYLKL